MRCPTLCQIDQRKWGKLPFGGSKICFISLSKSAGSAVDANGKLWTWGAKSFYLGPPNHPGKFPMQVTVPGGKPVWACQALTGGGGGVNIVLCGAQKRKLPTLPYTYDASLAGDGGGGGGEEEVKPLPPYPLSAYLLGEPQSGRVVNEKLVTFNVYSYADRDMVDANSGGKTSGFGANTGHKFLGFVNPMPQTTRFNIATRPCPGVKGDKHFYSVCTGAPKAGWQVSPAEYNHFYAYTAAEEGTTEFLVLERKDDACSVKVRPRATIDAKEMAACVVRHSFYAFTDHNQYHAKVILDETGSLDAAVGQLTSIDKKGFLTMVKGNSLILPHAATHGVAQAAAAHAARRWQVRRRREKRRLQRRRAAVIALRYRCSLLAKAKIWWRKSC
jgi:hypothetical protein